MIRIRTVRTSEMSVGDFVVRSDCADRVEDVIVSGGGLVHVGITRVWLYRSQPKDPRTFFCARQDDPQDMICEADLPERATDIRECDRIWQRYAELEHVVHVVERCRLFSRSGPLPDGYTPPTMSTPVCMLPHADALAYHQLFLEALAGHRLTLEVISDHPAIGDTQ